MMTMMSLSWRCASMIQWLIWDLQSIAQNECQVVPGSSSHDLWKGQGIQSDAQGWHDRASRHTGQEKMLVWALSLKFQLFSVPLWTGSWLRVSSRCTYSPRPADTPSRAVAHFTSSLLTSLSFGCIQQGIPSVWSDWLGTRESSCSSWLFLLVPRTPTVTCSLNLNIVQSPTTSLPNRSGPLSGFSPSYSKNHQMPPC